MSTPPGPFAGSARGWSDAELVLDLPAGFPDLRYECAKQGLFVLDAEAARAGSDAFGEVVDASPHLVVERKFWR